VATAVAISFCIIISLRSAAADEADVQVRGLVAIVTTGTGITRAGNRNVAAIAPNLGAARLECLQHGRGHGTNRGHACGAIEVRPRRARKEEDAPAVTLLVPPKHELGTHAPVLACGPGTGKRRQHVGGRAVEDRLRTLADVHLPFRNDRGLGVLSERPKDTAQCYQHN
jgi:hypothetical protein